MVDEQVMDFKYNPDSSVYINVEELKLKIRGAYNVRGLFHWLSHKKSQLNLHQKSQHEKSVRDGLIIVDNSGAIHIAIWGDLISNIE